MKLNPFIKNKKDKDMNPKEKETAKEQELNAENLADEQLQDTENTEEAAPDQRRRAGKAVERS